MGDCSRSPAGRQKVRLPQVLDQLLDLPRHPVVIRQRRWVPPNLQRTQAGRNYRHIGHKRRNASVSRAIESKVIPPRIISAEQQRQLIAQRAQASAQLPDRRVALPLCCALVMPYIWCSYWFLLLVNCTWARRVSPRFRCETENRQPPLIAEWGTRGTKTQSPVNNFITSRISGSCDSKKSALGHASHCR